MKSLGNNEINSIVSPRPGYEPFLGTISTEVISTTD
jgi:hypothetical protein